MSAVTFLEHIQRHQSELAARFRAEPTVPPSILTRLTEVESELLAASAEDDRGDAWVNDKLWEVAALLAPLPQFKGLVSFSPSIPRASPDDYLTLNEYATLLRVTANTLIEGVSPREQVGNNTADVVPTPPASPDHPRAAP